MKSSYIFANPEGEYYAPLAPPPKLRQPVIFTNQNPARRPPAANVDGPLSWLSKALRSALS